MKKLVEIMDKMNPFFNKIAQNIYLKSIMNGFMGMMYVIFFSSIFMIINSVPNAWGFYWSPEISRILLTPYNFTMGFLGLFISGSIAKSLADDMNKQLEGNRKISVISVFVASMVSYILLVVKYTGDGGLDVSDFGAPGIFVSIIVAFVTVNVYKFCIKNDIAIRLPEAVPPNVSESFVEIIPFSLSVFFFFLLDLGVRHFTGNTIVVSIMAFIQPIFSFGDSYLGFFLMMSSISVLTYVGIHGSTVVMSVVYPMLMVNLAENQAMLQAGQVPTNALTGGIVTAGLMGGSGATLAVCFTFAFMAKSKANRAVGKAALIPTNFMINEPILYGAPILMNPYFLVPYILAPGINAVIYRFFITGLGMPGTTITFGLGVPMMAALPAAHNFSAMSFVLLITILIVDFLIYYPFFVAYDNKMYQEELVRQEMIDEVEEVEQDIKILASGTEGTKVLVLCMAGGTSGLLANAINKGSKENGLDISARANQVNNVNFDEIGKLDLVVLAPQARQAFDQIKSETEKRGIALATTNGQEYIKLGQNPELALRYVINLVNKEGNNE